MKIKLIYLLIGAILVTEIYSTRVDTIDKDTLALIERSREIDLEQELWPGYKLSKYPIDVNYGKVEFKYDGEEITKQNPTLEVLAFTAYPEESGPIIKVLPKSMLGQVVNIMGNMSRKEIDDYYIATLFHEGFHALQITKDHMFKEEEDQNSNERFMNILYILDNDEEYHQLWIEEENSMLDYFENDNKESWLKSNNRRVKYLKEVLGNDFDFYMEMENERELIEGTAKYIEDKILEILTGDFTKVQINGSYSKGGSKFYITGRLKCLILDKGKDWKEGLFNSDNTLTDLLL